MDRFDDIDLVVVFSGLVWMLSIQLLMGNIVSRFMKYHKGSLWHQLHLQRRLQHCMSGMLVMYYQRNESETNFISFTSAAIFFTGIVHIGRLYLPLVRNLFVASFGGILRESETVGLRVPGAVYFLIGILLSYLVFSQTLCSLAILAVSVGDPCAGICGVLFPSLKLVGNKSLSGTLGCSIVTGMVIMGVCLWGDTRLSLLEGCVIGLAAGVAELFAVVDDNLTMPILFGGLVQITASAVLNEGLCPWIQTL